jgi:hypothetical protein
MRPNPLLLWILLCFAAAFATVDASAQQSARIAGRIVAARVRGPVTAMTATDKTPRPLSDNDTLAENATVNTGAGASATLVFSNGAVLNLGADSTLAIEEFLQDPFDRDIAVGDLKEEPSTSVTRLNLSRGELVGNVKHLHAERGSAFTVNTPVGVAGIRGTTFRIVFRPDASGKVFFTLSTADGTVVLQHGEAKQEVSVSTGKEIVVTVEANVDPVTGAVTITSAPVIGDVQTMSAESQATIATAVQQIVEDASAVIIKSTGTTTTGQPTDTGDAEKKDEGDTTKDNTPATPDPTTPSSNTTPGDGQSGG